MTTFLEHPSRFLFFTGKGGVGKTALACAADDYPERVIAPYRNIWTETQVGELREQLAGACTVEMAAFDEFAELLAGE